MTEYFTKSAPGQEAIRPECSQPSGMFVEFPMEDIETSIPARFEKIAEKHPGRLAVKSRERSLSYQELSCLANRIAHAILKHAQKPDERFALLFDQGVDVIAAILGVLKTGNMYVPLDPGFPMLRNQDALHDSAPCLILTNSRNCFIAKELAGSKIEVLDIDELASCSDAGNPQVPVTADTLAYILYTSGSTGKPKGVVQNHRNVLHLILRHANRACITPSDRIALLRSFNVHGGTLLTFAALLNGAAILPFDTRREGLRELAIWLHREEITLCRMGPTLLRHLTANLNAKDYYPKLREISFSGEPLFRKDIELCKRHLPRDCKLVNSFGATEVSSCCEYVLGDDSRVEEDVLPCGYATKDMEVFLLQDDGEETPTGEVGEIAVKSPFLALGYWRNPELTGAKFFLDRNGTKARTYRTGDQGRLSPGGCLVHLGRKDFQVKIRGYRVELSEVESALMSLDNIREAAVTEQKDRTGEKRLMGYVVPEKQPAPSSMTLRRGLQNALPTYMLPAIFVVLNEMPLTPNGKIDRMALPSPAVFRPDLDTTYVAPRNPIETELAAIWSEVLGMDSIGIDDNFFELGGHSLAAMSVVSRVIRTFQLELSLKALFEAPSVAEMAKVIMAKPAKPVSHQALERMLSDIEAMSEDEAERMIKIQRETNLKNG